LAKREGSPHLASTASRLALLSGQKAAARDLGAFGLSAHDIDSRTQVDLLLTSALAEESPDTGRRYLQQAIATAARTRSFAPFALAHRSSLRNLMGMIPSSPDRDWIETTLSSAPEPMPPAVEVVELTSKELRVLRFLADGASRPTIAQHLFISDNTVKFHIRNVYRKLGVASRADAVAKARQLRLLRNPDTDE
jgi:ATP/maltotriose-dependent transcriptional regulator MalT